MKTFLKGLLWIAIVAVAIFLVLFLTVRISGNFDTISELINYLIAQVTGGAAVLP